jgi:hypothetical protein
VEGDPLDQPGQGFGRDCSRLVQGPPSMRSLPVSPAQKGVPTALG